MFTRMFPKLTEIFNTLVAIARMERGPQDLPSSVVLMLVSLAAYLLFKVVLAWFLKPEHVLQSGLWDTAWALGVILVSLAVRRMLKRANQTLTAFAGIGIAVTAAAILVLCAVATAPWAIGMDLLTTGVPLVIMFPLVVLNLLINAHIFREALSTNFGVGMLLGVVYLIGVFAVR